MLIAAKQLHRCLIEGSDGDVGTLKDLLFDGPTWIVRYLDIDTGQWLPGQRVILSPAVIHTRDYPGHKLVTALSKEQVKNSPPLESDLPVTRQKEVELAQYYAWGAYWANVEADQEAADGDPELRSTQSVAGYNIRAADGAIGHVEDFIVDDNQWEIRYLVVDTRDWLPGRKVLIPPRWATAIRWDERCIDVEFSRKIVEAGPEFDPNTPINRQYEEVFYDYYGRPKYWTKAGEPV